MIESSRKKKTITNITSSLLLQVISFVCGFILPRTYLLYYGSSVNGLINSITQFLGLISLCECGIGSVIQTSLYKPLAEHNEKLVNDIIVSSDRFFRKIAFILVGFIVFLISFFPFTVSEEFSFIYTATLILAMAISTFAEYYWGISFRLLLSADQLGYIQTTVRSVILIINVIVSVIIIRAGFPIQFIKVISSLLFLIQPVFLRAFAKKRYNLSLHLPLEYEPIKQKWNGLAQHIASVVLVNTDTVVLTLFSTLKNVSIYGVYYMILDGIRRLVETIDSGLTALIGNMLSKKEIELCKCTFDAIEFVFHLFSTLFFSVAGLLIVPFVNIYTRGITDTNYIVYDFAVLLTISQWFRSLQVPYTIMTRAAGHYKETQWSYVTEAIMNVALSVILVLEFQMVGVAIGTIVAIAYRCLYLVNYLKNNILCRKISYFIKHFIVDIICVVFFVFVNRKYMFLMDSYFEWFIVALKVFLLTFVEYTVINILFFRKSFSFIVTSFIHRNMNGKSGSTEA